MTLVDNIFRKLQHFSPAKISVSFSIPLDGTLRIKGKKHLEWFADNIEKILASGSKDLAAPAELGHIIDIHMRLEDGYTVNIEEWRAVNDVLGSRILISLVNNKAEIPTHTHTANCSI